MAGIYLHIPFCKQKCAYCDFFSVANTKLKDDFVKAICKEIVQRKDYLGNKIVQTIYFGGGTPSMLSAKEIEAILETIHKNYKVDLNNEISLEANPDDLDSDYLRDIIKVGINRLSIGVQSFHDKDLQVMKRKHNKEQARRSIINAQEIGFKNISVDLIYGLPELTLKKWEENINEILRLNIQHISAYHLTIELKTGFYKLHKNKKIKLPSEDESLDQFKMLIEKTAENGFLHYEISNFAKDGSISLHNTNYWMDVKYLGLGPSAHSYNLTSRQWNISNLQVYSDRILKGQSVIEMEKLSINEKYNEFVITSLRTMWGLNTKKLKSAYGNNFERHFLDKSKALIEKNLIVKSGNNFILTKKGMFISDSLMEYFMIV